MRRLAVPFLLAAVLTGCSSTEPGKPTAGDSGTGTPTTGTSAGTAPVSRPKAVDLKTIDPCTLITPEKKTALGLNVVKAGDPLADYGEGSKRCNQTYADQLYISNIHTLLNGGVDRLKQTTGESKLTPVKVAGYPAYLTRRESPGSAGACEVYIDANDGQLLLVNGVAGFADDKATVDGACERAKALAEAVGAVLATK
ncbi:DUF3558 domain-containing protein [Lentzea sp. NPDC058450]|uniref:DUF3558 domain-containing protein n=1 Tax=Lentzea sp. NPDC058450 TaxID=3346505 RepID=UPI00365B2EB3